MTAPRCVLNSILLLVISLILTTHIDGNESNHHIRGSIRQRYLRKDELVQPPAIQWTNFINSTNDNDVTVNATSSKGPTNRPTDSPTNRPTTIEPSASPSIEFKTFATTFESDSTYAGNQFDIVARENIEISSMGIHTYVKRNITMQIYTRVGSYRGAEKDISQWTHVGNTTLLGRGLGVPTMMNEGAFEPMLIRKNQRQAFYVTTDGPWLRATKGTNEGEEIYFNSREEESDISFYQGVGNKYPMTDGTFSPRIWNGLLLYRIVDTIPSPPPTSPPTSPPTPPPTPTVKAIENQPVTFRRGDLAVDIPHLGIKVCTGMSVKVIARANQPIQFAEGSNSNNDLPFHSMPDGAAIFPLENDGYVYVSNSEMKEGLGGVYGLYFDGDGNVVDYKRMLSGTTRNCGGGRTPWDTWVSCEEYGRGQCWQVDPKNQRTSQITKLGGARGGNYESVAVDNRNPDRPIFFLTEDHERGALRKYSPAPSTIASWDTLHAEGGSTKYLVFLENNRFKWTNNEDRARSSQQEHFRNVEGIDYNDGFLYFVSKKMLMLYVLDLDNGTYRSSSTKDGVLVGAGEFRHSPDQIVRNNEGEYLYLTEDGGKTVGVYAIHTQTGQRYAIFESHYDKYVHDETTGLAFSLDGSKMYAAFQDCGCEDSEGGVDFNCGCLMEFSRSDGRSFDGSTTGLKFHSS